ncbi:MAG: glycosyltransferase family 2 protein [Patescibacteria group bacterium]|nr:glycosyltransferase family 2 protein [Patescibacteria group bacterium]
MRDKIYIVIPALNESRVIQEVIGEINKQGYKNVIVVDDGSQDNTYARARRLKGVTALRHKINCGKGAAAKTGLAAARRMGADIVVTMDGDGQHDARDIRRIIKPISQGMCEVALGTRLTRAQEMPVTRKAANRLGNFLTWLLYGIWVTDSQSGFRAYSREALELVNPRADRYDFDSEIIREIKLHNLNFQEVPIKARYTEYSLSKQEKQGVLNGLKTVYKMVWNLIS